MAIKRIKAISLVLALLWAILEMQIENPAHKSSQTECGKEFVCGAAAGSELPTLLLVSNLIKYVERLIYSQQGCTRVKLKRGEGAERKSG